MIGRMLEGMGGVAHYECAQILDDCLHRLVGMPGSYCRCRSAAGPTACVKLVAVLINPM
jgi:hypothetical protein